MIAVIFEVLPSNEAARTAYLEIAAQLRPLLDGIEGFVSIERFQRHSGKTEAACSPITACALRASSAITA